MKNANSSKVIITATKKESLDEFIDYGIHHCNENDGITLNAFCQIEDPQFTTRRVNNFNEITKDYKRWYDNHMLKWGAIDDIHLDIYRLTETIGNSEGK